MEQVSIEERKKGRCKKCNKKLLLNSENLCLVCENELLYAELMRKELFISQLKRKLYGRYYETKK